MRRFFAKSFMLVGIVSLLYSLFLVYQRNNPQRLSFPGYVWENHLQESGELAEKPEYLQIKDLGIILPVIPAQVKKDAWETTKKGVSYLTSTPLPGQVGNSIFYGHNFRNLLGNLTEAKPGQMVEVIFTNGRSEKFMIEYVQVVDSGKVSILQQTEDRRLTVYTCTGFLDRKRLVVTAIADGR